MANSGLIRFNEGALLKLRECTEMFHEPNLDEAYPYPAARPPRHSPSRGNVGEELLGIFAVLLNAWAEEMDRHFCFRLVVPRVVIERLERGVDGVWRWRNGREVIVLDEGHVICDKRREVLATLLHEMLHSVQHQHGHACDDGDHDSAFRCMALSVGLNFDSHGHTSFLAGPTPLVSLLRAHCVQVPQGLLPATTRRGSFEFNDLGILNGAEDVDDVSSCVIAIMEMMLSTTLERRRMRS